ncbi:hypothetical protein NEAUS03_1277 [Nematocida ausubeli]|nr:hypothetical protein NEAUS03_1277 [Nematocida ausubeli]
MLRLFIVLYFAGKCLSGVEIQRSVLLEDVAVFEADGQLAVYSLSARKVIEKIAMPLHRFSTVHNRITNTQAHRDSPGNEEASGVNTSSNHLQNAAINPSMYSNVNLESLGIQKSTNIYTIQERQGNTEIVPCAAPTRSANSAIIVPGGIVASKEKRIGVEYIRSCVGVIVCVYNETVTKVFKKNGMLEYIDRELTTILNATVVTRSSLHIKALEDLQCAYNTNIYLLKEIDNMYYFSKVSISEIAEVHKTFINIVLNWVLCFCLFIGGLFLVIPVGIRIFGHRDKSITIFKGPRPHDKLHPGMLFGTKKVLVRIFRKSRKEERDEHRNIALLNEIQSTCLYAEETREHFFMVYPRDMQPLCELVKNTLDLTDLIFTLHRYMGDLHRRGIGQIDLTMHNIFITPSNTLLLLGVAKMAVIQETYKLEKTAQNSKLERVSEEEVLEENMMERCITADYFALSRLCYNIYVTSKWNECCAGNYHQKEFSEALPDILLYDYRKYPKFIMDANSKYRIELFDWMATLCTNTTVQSPVPHPIFWTHTQSLEFLSLFSDFVFDHPAMLVLETSKIGLTITADMSNWDVYIDIDLLNHLTRNGKYYYNTKVLRDLLRLIRNNGRHFQSIPAEGREYFEDKVSIFLSFFLKKFAYIILLIYYTAEEYGLLHEKIFVEIFQPQ